MALVMALCVAEKRQIRCNYGKFILESLIEANLKNSSKNKLYMSVGPMLTRIAYQALGIIEDLPAIGSQASLIQHARFVPKVVKTTTTVASSRTTRSSKKSSSDDERMDIDKAQDSEGSDKEDSPKGAEAKGPSEHELSDQEDTSTPLDKKSKKPPTTEQVLMDEAMAKVEARRKELANARAAKATKISKPMTTEEARKIRKEREEKKKLEAEQKAQHEAVAAQGDLQLLMKFSSIFEGALENLPVLRQQHGMSKSVNEALLVIEAYKALRDHAPYPPNQVVGDLSGHFAFILLGNQTKKIVIAKVVHRYCQQGYLLSSSTTKNCSKSCSEQAAVMAVDYTQSRLQLRLHIGAVYVLDPKQAAITAVYCACKSMYCSA
ncbi:hypothetical protein L7F22_005590 [Adiantum nelumboides]|nr:hypothetical protein [Adiantum nelumboides]